MTALTGAGAAAAIPSQHYAPKGGCGHQPKPMPMPLPGPGPVPLPHPEPMPMPHPDYGTPPMAPPGMYALSGGTTEEIARGIVELYDQDRSGTISAEEAVRVQRDHGGFNDGMIQIPSKFGFGGGSTTVDVFAMTKLLVKADTNHNGRVGINELTKTLKQFDTGDDYPSYSLPHGPGGPGGPEQHIKKPGAKTAGDGRLSGSEFDRFMMELGEQHIGSWQEPSYWGDYGFDKGFPLPGPGVPPAVHGAARLQAGARTTAPAAAAAPTADAAGE